MDGESAAAASLFNHGAAGSRLEEADPWLREARRKVRSCPGGMEEKLLLLLLLQVHPLDMLQLRSSADCPADATSQGFSGRQRKQKSSPLNYNEKLHESLFLSL